MKRILVDVIAFIVGGVLVLGYLTITVGARMALHITPGDTDHGSMPRAGLEPAPPD